MIGINMEMPEKCGLCPLFHAEYPMYCQGVKADRKKKIVAPYGQPRPDWCPLRPLDDNEIRVGDEMVTSYGSCVVVLGIDSRADSLFTVCSDGSCGTHDAKHFTKTGRHFDEVEALLRKMRGKSND